MHPALGMLQWCEDATGIQHLSRPCVCLLGNDDYSARSKSGKGGCLIRYGFHKESAGGEDPEGGKKARLLQIFGHWTDMVTDLIRATPEEDVIRRDIYDRPPIFKWTEVRRSGACLLKYLSFPCDMP